MTNIGTRFFCQPRPDNRYFVLFQHFFFILAHTCVYCSHVRPLIRLLDWTHFREGMMYLYDQTVTVRLRGYSQKYMAFTSKRQINGTNPISYHFPFFLHLITWLSPR